MRPHALALACLALAAAPALAQSRSDADQKAMVPQVSHLSVFLGSWGCTGKAFANPAGPEHATAATVKGTMAVGNAWVHLTYDESAQGNPMPVHAAMYMGWDDAQKKFVVACVDSFGGTCAETSAGWNADTIVFEGSGMMMGKKTGSRDTFTRKGRNEIGHLGEMQGEDGTWTKVNQETCKRKGK